MKKFIGTLLFVLASPAVSAAYILDFSGDICTTAAGVCANGSSISQDYGDIAGQLDVIYDANRNTATEQELRWWGTGYETLTGVAYGTLGGGGLSILFKPEAGYEVSVTSFDIAPYANRVRDTFVEVIDIATNTVLFTQSFNPLPTGMVTTLESLMWTSLAGIQINLGPDSWDIGIDNIHYSVKPADLSEIPLPAAGWLLLSGLGMFGLVRRRLSNQDSQTV